MSESAQAPADSSNGSPSPPSDSPPAKNDSQPLDTPPSPVVDGSLPPSNAEKTPSLPDQSSSSPPPTESIPSPPPPTLSPPPPSPTDSSPPVPSSDLKTPPEPNSPPPKASPPSDSKSSSPPPPKESSSEAPSGSVIVPPPPASQSPPSENPANPPPTISSGSPSKPPSSPPAQPNAPSTPETPQIIIPPPVPGSPPAPITQDPLPLIPSVPSAPISSIPGSNPSPKSASPSREHGGHASSTPDQSSPSTKPSDNSSSGSVAGVAVAGVVIIALVAVFFVISRKRKRKGKAYYIAPPDNFSVQTEGYYYGQQHAMTVSGQHSHEFYSGKLPPQSGNGATFGSSGAGHMYNFSGPESGVFGTKSSFGYEELMEITNGFSRENILGEGGFGCVYKGWLPDGRVVAVKQLKAGSGQGEREFRAEVEIISRVHHRHLVTLVGYCIAEYHRLLVYEFVPNNNLEHHLHGNGMPPLEWSKRMKIAAGSARGLAYLHEDCHPKIIHRDIKSANILLDDAFEAQVADFGLAKLSNDINSHVSTRVMGTFGYMAPEYASSGKLTDRSDVYSFGVVLLELITGRKPIDASQDESLVEWARPLLIQALEAGDMSALIDPRLEKRYVESEMFRMIETAAACVRHSAPKRPRMVQVVRALDTDGDMPDLTNGVKVGQSTIFGPANSEIQRFQRMAFGSGDGSDYDIYSGEFREVPLSSSTSGKPGESNTSAELPSGELESRPMNPQVGSRRI